ncbi:probable plastid-lipid-associated protein 4, chloroplastic isoform X3 [Vitis vinifera]|uniref:probable plastid-lipid-associated protein 4, chloroplastic isoform X3 n=1 Tax=Vitis vinifera TaxID=29760 RepID=UPI0008FEBC7C|nr:probable plastid-lipid-associated protein 4, chloroplastic isoform X3 [Vitis vinifera]|eukprot:XP_019078777.1 PREDICTED: probable plastid-lipid-associated protein 4, chloroplastic isoform X2 [Vitis vinifera]
MAISSYSCSSYPSATLLNGTLHSSFTDLFISRTPLPINIKPKPILTTTQTYHYHPHKALEFSGYWKWRTGVSFFPSFLTKSKDSEALKEELFTAIAPLDRGAEATAQDQELVDQIARKLEAVNKIKEPLKSDLLNGKWELLYTTSQSVLQTQVTANLVPLNARRVAVKFDFFRIAGLIPIKSPGSGRGQLEITYLDEELRISRGDRGNLFILKMVDPSYRVPL